MTRKAEAQICSLRWRRHAVVLALLAACVACREPVAPAPVPTISVAVIRTADWFAYRNQGGDWTPLAPGPSGYEFLATPTVAIASAINRAGMDVGLRVEYLTAAELLQESARSRVPTPQYTGSASGVARGIPPGPYWAYIGHGPNMGNVTGAGATNITFSLPTWSAPMDLVATLVSSADSSREITTGQRAILRRAQQLSPGSTVDLQFDGPEAFPLGTATLAWTGPELGIEVQFISGTGSRALLSRVQGTSSAKAVVPRTRVVARMPTERSAPSDLYQLSFGDYSSNAQRVTTRWTHALVDTVLDLGRAPAPPTITVESSGGDRRPQFVVPTPAEYGDFVSAVAEQKGAIPGTPYIGTLRRIRVGMSKGYVGGTRDVWTLEVPDLRRVAGFPSAVLLVPGGFSWSLEMRGCNCSRFDNSIFDGKISRYQIVSDTMP